MAPRDILDAREVEPGLDIGGHSPVEELDDNPPGRRRLVIIGADRGGRIHDHHGNALARGFARFLLGEKLRSLIGAHHIRERHRRILATDSVWPDTERADRAGMHDSPRPRRTPGRDYVACPFDVRRVHRRRIEHPQAVIRGHVIDFGASIGGPLDRRAIA